MRRGVFKGTTLSMTVRKLRLVRPDVALIDIDVGVFACHARPPGVQARSDGALRACLLMVLTKDHGKWWIPHKNATSGKAESASSAISQSMASSPSCVGGGLWRAHGRTANSFAYLLLWLSLGGSRRIQRRIALCSGRIRRSKLQNGFRRNAPTRPSIC